MEKTMSNDDPHGIVERSEKAKEIGLPGELSFADYIIRLEDRISRLEYRLNAIGDQAARADLMFTKY